MRSMSRPEPAFTAIILAAQRAGRVDPVAEAAGVPNKSLAPIGGAPLIRHVAQALAATPGLAKLRIVVEPETVPALRVALAGIRHVEFVAAADNLADSVYAAASGVDHRMLVTTSDNVLLTPAAVRAMLDTLAGGVDVALALAAQASVLAAHPEGQRRFYRFADGAYSNCNLYAFGGGGATGAAEAFRSGGQFAKKPLRMILALGPLNLALMMMGRLTLRGAIQRIARRFGLRVEPVILSDGAQAIDVDNARTYACAETLLAQRQALTA